MLRPISSGNSIAESTASNSVYFSEPLSENSNTWLGKRGRINKSKSRKRKQEAVGYFGKCFKNRR